MNIAEKISLFRWGVHYEGWFFTAFRLIVKAASFFGLRGVRSEWFQHLSEQQFDKRFEVKTSGLMKPHEMKIPEDRLEHAVEYAPTSANRFGWLLSSLPYDLSDFTFVDIGSGKGRVLLMASEFPFQQVLGVELAQELHENAVENIKKFNSKNQQCQKVHSFNQDATSFQFPETPLVLYFFNPFSAEILNLVLDNLHSSLKEKPRQVIALYYNPLHAEVFQNSPHFSKPNFNVHPGAGWEIFVSEPNS